METFKELLIKLHACKEALEWAGNKTWEEVYNTCHRGDWLLWLHTRTNKEDLKLRTLVKGHCANTVRYLMTDQRSRKAVDTAIAYGEGRATRAELDAAAAAGIADAAAADYAAYFATAAAYAAYAADAAAYAADAAAYASYADEAGAYDATYAAYFAAGIANAAAYAAGARAKIKNQKETADIVRKYIPIELWNVNKMIFKKNN